MLIILLFTLVAFFVREVFLFFLIVKVFVVGCFLIFVFLLVRRPLVLGVLLVITVVRLFLYYLNEARDLFFWTFFG